MHSMKTVIVKQKNFYKLRFLIDIFFLACIDFKEFVCGISAACRGPQYERYKCKKQLLSQEKNLIFYFI
jgi:hypothetical protein